jgi:hypothetical protein
MTTRAPHVIATPRRALQRAWGAGVERVGNAAALWSLLYGLLGVYWMTGGLGFPFGSANDPRAAAESILGGVRADTAAPVVAVLGLAGAAVAMALTRSVGRAAGRGGGHANRLMVRALLAFAWAAAVALLLVIPDRRVLIAVAYAPVFLVGAPFGWPPVSFLTVVPWPVVNQVILMVGGFLWAATAVVSDRHALGACAWCGRTGAGADLTTPAAAARWGRWAVAIAVTVPLLYTTTRLAWAFGVPLGISHEFLREGQRIGMWKAGAALSAVDITGVILTLGLVQRWGEVFPRWMLGLSGRRVPPALAIVPASVVSVLVTSAGLHAVWDFLQHGFPPDGWATTGPGLLWPAWGVALGAATLAYHYRRRGACRHCGRGQHLHAGRRS